MKSIKHIIIVYNPGYAGNFLARLFSLDRTVCPQVKLNWAINDLDIFNTPRLNLYTFKEVVTQYESWQSFHREWSDLYNYHLLGTYFKEKNFSSIVFACHEPEFQLHQDLITSFDDKIILGVKIKDCTNLEWINLAQKDLNFKYRYQEKEFYSKFINSLDNTNLIDFDKILKSETDFLEEYNRISKLISIDADNSTALKFYQEWYAERVSRYLKF